MSTHVQHELETMERRQQYKSKRENKVSDEEIIRFSHS